MYKIFFAILSLFVVFQLNAQIAQGIKLQAQVTGMPGGSYSSCWGHVGSDGKEYAIIGSTLATNIYEITNCAAPVLKYTYQDGTNSIWREYKSYNNFLYGVVDNGGASNNEGLEIFNLTNMNAITVTHRTTEFLKAHTLSVDSTNARLYISGALSGSSNERLIIYDISNPASPVLLRNVRLDEMVGDLTLNLYIHDLYVKDHLVYASHGNSGYYIWDCTDPLDIKLLGQNDDIVGYNHSSWKHPIHDVVYVLFETNNVPIQIYKLIYNLTQTPPNVTINDTLNFRDPLMTPTTNLVYHNPFIKGNELYVSSYNDGLQVYDITNPYKPIRAAYYDTYHQNNTSGYNGQNGQWSVFPFLPSGCLVASDISNGLFTMKLDLPKVKVTNGDFGLLTASSGIIFRDSTDVNRRLTVSNSGVLQMGVVASVDTSNVIRNSDLEITDINKGIILRSPNGTAYKVQVNNNGVLFTTPAGIVPSNNTNVFGNVYINNKYKGIIMRSPDGKRWKSQPNTTGVMKTVTWSM